MTGGSVIADAPGTTRVPLAPERRAPEATRRPLGPTRILGLLARHALVVAVFALPGVALWWHAWDGHLASVLACECGDSGQAVWFVAWPAYALAHGLDPFFSRAVQAPSGVNLLANASSVPVGIALAPLTWLAGPVVSTNVALTLAPAASAWACWVAAGDLVGAQAARLAAAGLFGYSPFVVTNLMVGHIGLALLVTPPLLLVALRRILFAPRTRRTWWGAGAGALVACQFFISSEVLAIIAVVGLPCLALCVLVGRRTLAPPGELIRAALAAGLVVVALLAWPVWFFLAGPGHLAGPLWPGASIQDNVLSALWSPGHYAWPGSTLLRFGGYEGHSGPPSAYLGPVVLAAAALSLIVSWRRRTAWLLALAGALAAVLSLGVLLRVTPHDINGTWLPWRVVASWPLLDDVIPQRFSAVSDLCVALLVAVGLDRAVANVRARLARRAVHRPPRVRGSWGVAVAGWCAAVVLAASVWSTYQVPLVTRRATTPRWYAAVGGTVAPGSVVLSYPFPFPADGSAAPMVWQATSTMRFSLAGAYAKAPGPHRRPLALASAPLAERVLAALSARAAGPLPSPTPRAIGAVRAALSRWDVTWVVVTVHGRDPAAAVAFFGAVTGRAPRRSHGAWVWRLQG